MEEKVANRYWRKRDRVRRLVDALFLIRLGLALMVLVALIVLAVWNLRLPASSPISVAFVTVSILLIVITAFDLVYRGWTGYHLRKGAEEVAQTVAILRDLRQKHPELVELQEAMDLLGETKGRETAWSNFWWSVFFTGLGFTLSYIATKFGWLR